MKRTFIAVKSILSEENRNLFFDIKKALKDSSINWVDKENMHLTLFFLGNTAEEKISEICSQLTTSLNNLKSFKYTIKGLGVFKNINDPRVIWFGIEDANDLRRIKSKIDEVLISLGFLVENREFKPHLTLGRIKHLKQKDLLNELVEKYKDQKLQEIFVNEVIFYESILTPKGPIYNEIQKFILS